MDHGRHMQMKKKLSIINKGTLEINLRDYSIVADQLAHGNCLFCQLLGRV